MENHLDKIRNKRRDYIFAGNWQIAADERDVQQAVNDDTPGFLLEERRWLDEAIHKLGYCDAFREANQDDDEFSWWPDGDKSNGWRVDFQLVSAGMKQYVEYGMIYKKQDFSSHAAVVMDYDYFLGEDDF